ncbi:sensor histidine kinase [Clostridium thermarum]|uniref:sensor histidine kinase n=1 Tax=Clostridium thermarum TaxID=1716543 RepID=UPI0013D67F9A|nr:ATP-binding protein [Clostridium thermarum]
MLKSLSGKLIFSYIFIASLSVLLISIMSNMFLVRLFNNYIMDEHQRKSKDVVHAVNEQYNNDGSWNISVIERIGIDALENGLILKITDASGEFLWDAEQHNHGRCEALIEHFSKNMMSRYPNWQGGFVKETYTMEYKGSFIGNVEIGYYGPFYYTDHDLIFLETLNKIFISVGGISLLLSIIAGIIMAQGLSKPIEKVIKSAEAVTKGNYKNRITEKSSTTEIINLIHSINKMADYLEKQELLRKRLTADVAHELRTPLATLQSHMEAMIDGVWDPTADRLKSCHEEIMRINRMVGDLEKLAQYEKDNLNITKSRFDLAELVQSILLNFEADYMNKGIEIVFERKDVWINADRDKLSQVIINLLSNALKYTPERGKVEIEIKKEGKTALLYVKDNGVGISKEDLPHIFERFYRVDKSRSRITGGAGIGLTISKAIVEAHGGCIGVESTIGEGTTFTVALPD